MAEKRLLAGDSTIIDGMLNVGMRMFMTDIPKTLRSYLKGKGLHG